jgi:hypothetical protein
LGMYPARWNRAERMEKPLGVPQTFFPRDDKFLFNKLNETISGPSR